MLCFFGRRVTVTYLGITAQVSELAAAHHSVDIEAALAARARPADATVLTKGWSQAGRGARRSARPSLARPYGCGSVSFWQSGARRRHRINGKLILMHHSVVVLCRKQNRGWVQASVVEEVRSGARFGCAESGWCTSPVRSRHQVNSTPLHDADPFALPGQIGMPETAS